ncbi:MAG: hypothetical protein QOG15_197 [Solirubrobacteraceae bacterium]|nr:hypothetical protein [Solirubrobacteraceae bacterium]
MARRTSLISAVAALLCALPAVPAFAHAGNPNYESLVNGVKPSIPGFSVVVLNGDDRLEVVDRSPAIVVIDGYQKEPYVRMDPDGTVAVNLRSPAYYLNNDRAGTAPIPASADPKAAPQWKVVAHDGRYQFHDHRMHWMGAKNPPQVKDESVRTKVNDWRVPVQTAGKDGAITGTLFWRGSSGGPPAGAFIGLALLVLLSVATVVIVRRRRGQGGADGVGEPQAEAW